MKIYSIDTETTGVDPNINNILTIGAVVAELRDEKLYVTSRFNKVFYKQQLTISSGAYKINKALLDWYFERNEKKLPKYRSNSVIPHFITIGDHPLASLPGILDKDTKFRNYDDVYYEDIVRTLYTRLIYEQSVDDGANRKFDFDDVLIIGKNYDKFDREFLLNSINRYGNTKYTADLKNLLNRTSYDIGIANMDLSSDTKIPHTEKCFEKLGIEYNKDILHHSMYDAYIMLQAFAKLQGFELMRRLDDSMFKNYEILD